MKAEIKKEAKVFNPIEISITIESEVELKVLYAMFNVSNDDIIKKSNDTFYDGLRLNCSDKFNRYPVYEKLRDIAVELNLRS